MTCDASSSSAGASIRRSSRQAGASTRSCCPCSAASRRSLAFSIRQSSRRALPNRGTQGRCKASTPSVPSSPDSRSPMHAPADEYRARLSARRDTHARLSRIDEQFSYARLAVFAAVVLLIVGAWRGWVAPWWIALPVVGFVALIVKHDAVIRRRDAAARAIAFYDRGLARIEDRWAGGGEPGERFRNPEHLYANDLDLFGPASLFELLSIARTRAGEDTLAAWLLAPAEPGEIRARQQATGDLTTRLDLREALSLAGSDVRAAVHTDALVAWAEAPPLLGSGWRRPAAIVLTIAAIASVAVWISTGNSTPFLAIVMVEIAFSWPLRQRILKALHGADAAARDLDVLAVVLARLERESFNPPRLAPLPPQITHTHGEQR